VLKRRRKAELGSVRWAARIMIEAMCSLPRSPPSASALSAGRVRSEGPRGAFDRGAPGALEWSARRMTRFEPGARIRKLGIRAPPGVSYWAVDSGRACPGMPYRVPTCIARPAREPLRRYARTVQEAYPADSRHPRRPQRSRRLQSVVSLTGMADPVRAWSTGCANFLVEDRPLALWTSDRNSQSWKSSKPNSSTVPVSSVGQDDFVANSSLELY